MPPFQSRLSISVLRAFVLAFHLHVSMHVTRCRACVLSPTPMRQVHPLAPARLHPPFPPAGVCARRALAKRTKREAGD